MFRRNATQTTGSLESPPHGPSATESPAAERHRALIRRFYEAFDRCDGDAMADCYSRGAAFRDPVFGKLEGQHATNMWRMLTAGASNLRVELLEHDADDSRGHAHWRATYDFGTSRRPVTNDVRATFRFADGLIAEHVDDFSFLSWSRQALGRTGLAMGLVPPARTLVRRRARSDLKSYERRRPGADGDPRYVSEPSRQTTASYLDRYDALGDDQVEEKVGLVNRWIRTEWPPFYAELRARRPIFRTPAYTLVARFADVTEVLSRERSFTVRPYAPRMDPVVDGPFMLARDGTPINWREKGIMQGMLAPEDLPRVRALAGQVADEALDTAAPDGRIEVVSRLGRHVAIRICGDYFGFPGPDLPTMYRWSRATQSDMFKNLQNDPEVHEASVRAGAEMREYLAELLQEKATVARQDGGADPPQDVFSRLVRTRLPAEIGFDDQRIMANMAGLLIGAGETTSQAIVHALEQLLLRPAVCARAVAAARAGDTVAFDRYVWEALRFNPINPLLFRYCEADHTLAAGTPRETTIPAGTLVFACTPSAMFDEDVVPDAQEFRTDRPDFIDMHFGYGHHACLGRYVGAHVVPEVVRRVLMRDGVRLLPPPDGAVDFQGGPFPERFVVALGDVPVQRPTPGAVA